MGGHIEFRILATHAQVWRKIYVLLVLTESCI